MGKIRKFGGLTNFLTITDKTLSLITTQGCSFEGFRLSDHSPPRSVVFAKVSSIGSFMIFRRCRRSCTDVSKETPVFFDCGSQNAVAPALEFLRKIPYFFGCRSRFATYAISSPQAIALLGLVMQNTAMIAGIDYIGSCHWSKPP